MEDTAVRSLVGKCVWGSTVRMFGGLLIQHKKFPNAGVQRLRYTLFETCLNVFQTCCSMFLTGLGCAGPIPLQMLRFLVPSSTESSIHKTLFALSLMLWKIQKTMTPWGMELSMQSWLFSSKWVFFPKDQPIWGILCLRRRTLKTWRWLLYTCWTTLQRVSIQSANWTLKVNKPVCNMLLPVWNMLKHVLNMSWQVMKMFCTAKDIIGCMKRTLLAKAPGMVSFQYQGFLERLPCCQISMILMLETSAFLHGQGIRGKTAFQTDKHPLKANQAADATTSTHLPWNLEELGVCRVN